MERHNFEVSYEICATAHNLPGKYRELHLAAEGSLQVSYAPYSQFRVGAALLLNNGTIVAGANQENAAYPLCLCAERNALAIAHNQFPTTKIEAIFIVADYQEALISPCGACRQVLCESEYRQQHPIQIWLQGPGGTFYHFSSAQDLLPFQFSPNSLP